MDVDRTAWRSTLVKSHDENKTYILVKLSESFSNAIQEYSTPTIKFQGSRGAIKFPNGKNYDFSLEQQDRDVECIRQTKHRWESVGKVACCLHVKGKYDVYQRTRTKMAAAEKEKRKYCTKLLNSPEHDTPTASVSRALPIASTGSLNSASAPAISRTTQPNNNFNNSSASRGSSKLLDPTGRASSSSTTTVAFGANQTTATTSGVHTKTSKISNNSSGKHHNNHKGHQNHNHNNINHNNHLTSGHERKNHNHYNHTSLIDGSKSNNSSYISGRTTDIKSSSSLLSSSSSSSSSSASSSSSSAPASTSTTTTTNNTTKNNLNKINLSKYPDITDVEQLKRYKADFDKDFQEYQHLHGYLQRIEEKFKKLRETLKQSIEGSAEWESAKEEIFSEYDRIKGDSNFHKARSKYKQLRERLAHIKEKIFQFKRDNRDKFNCRKKRKR